MKAYLGVLLLFFSAPARADHINLCRYLLTAHSEQGSSTPRVWEKIERTLRTKVRTGWIKKGISGEIAETVLEHSQKVRQAAKLYSLHHPDVDPERAGYMGLIHDLAEWDAEDFTPDAQISIEAKHQIELKIWDSLIQEIPAAKPLQDLWLEYEMEQTPTAKLVMQIDKLDAAIQALKYEKLGYSNLNGFYVYTKQKLTDPCLVKILEILHEKKFPLINVYDQYFTLLSLNGNKEEFERKMEAKSIEINKSQAESARL